MTFKRCALLIAILLFGTTAPCFGQALAPFAAVTSGPDQINLGTLDIHFTQPLADKPGRGLPLTYNLGWDNSVWMPSGGAWVPRTNFGFTGGGLTGGGVAAWNGVLTYSYTSGCQTYPYVGTICWSSSSNYVYTDANGTAHGFTYWEECSSGCSSGGSTVASDGSGYALYGGGVAIPSGVVILPGNNGRMTDSNGNYISVSTNSGAYSVFTDTTNQSALSINPIPNDNQVEYGTPGGLVYLLYQNFTVQTNFRCSGISEFGPKTESLPTGASFGDGTGFAITYEQTPGYPNSITGRIAKITLRTGGTITYTYPSTNDGISCSDGSSTGFTRQTPDGSSTYTRSQSGTASTTTIVDPQGDTTVMNFQGIYPTETQVLAPGGALLRTTITCYNGTAPSGTPPTCNSNAVTLPITEKTVYTQLPDGGNILESEVDTLYDKELAGNITNSYGLVKEVDEYDYGSNAVGSLVRKTITNYASLGNNILNRPSSVTVCSPVGSASACNGSGTVVAQTTYTYDQGSVTPISSTPQHASVTGSRGNPTAISYLTSVSSTLNKSFTYYDTGKPDVITDVNGAHTTYNYPDATTTCGNTLPDSVTEPLGLSTSTSWNCTYGGANSTTDENGAKTTWGFGTTGYICSYYPPACVTGVTDPMGNFTQAVSDTASKRETALNFNSNNSTVDSASIMDGLGRLQFSEVKEGPSSSTYDISEIDYDSLGRPSRTTLPYPGSSGTPCSTCAGTTATYDALGRPTLIQDSGMGTITYSYSGNAVTETVGPAPTGENVKTKQLTYDALGRLTEVIEDPGLAPHFNYITQYTYDALGDLTHVTQGAQTRSYSYDGLGRMTSETNPESGTFTYVYDSVGSVCYGGISSPGDEVEKIDAAGNIQCYWHDALHRLTDIGAPGYKCTRLRYDNTTGILGSIPSGITIANTMGRLAEAATDNCAYPITQASIITDEWFSYDARGETTDLWQSTLHSGGYLHSAANYWANGALDASAGALGYWTNYIPDGEGRVNSVGGGNELASTVYNPAGLPTQLTFPSGDSDSFTYDSNTNRMTQYKYTVNGQSVIGNLTWNANGTLGSLSITDPFNSNDAQSCTYTHDDLARLSSVSCSGPASPWSQTFTYDAYGNIITSGSGTFQPGYNSSNQMMAPAAYDANGNATNDEEHTYSWNSYGQPYAIDGISVTYDALGRLVEVANGGTYNQMQYSPTGFLMYVLTGGQTEVEAIAPMPGGDAEVWTPSTSFYRHADWLGSSRFTRNYDAAYSPFGQPYAETGTTDRVFTGMEQNIVSGLYDFPAREYNRNEGRWPSPDPAGLAAVDAADPQTWNRYAYVRNSPLMMIDPSGLDGLDYYDCPGGDGNNDCGGNQELLDNMLTFPDAFSSGGDPRNIGWLPTPWQPGCWTDTGTDTVTCFPYDPVFPVDPLANCQFALVIPCGAAPRSGGSAAPQAPLHPPTQQQYNACMQQAASTRNSALLSARGEQVVGGLLTLIGVGTAAYSLPALGEGFFNEGAAGLVDFAHAGGFAYFGALGPLGAGVGVFGKGSYDVANAWNQYYANTISCAASHP